MSAGRASAFDEAVAALNDILPPCPPWLFHHFSVESTWGELVYDIAFSHTSGVQGSLRAFSLPALLELVGQAISQVEAHVARHQPLPLEKMSTTIPMTLEYAADMEYFGAPEFMRRMFMRTTWRDRERMAIEQARIRHRLQRWWKLYRYRLALAIAPDIHDDCA